MQTDQLIAQLAATPAPTKAQARSPLRLSGRWLLAFLLYGVLATTFSDMPPELWLAAQHPMFVLELLLLVGIIVSSVYSAALLSFPDLYQRPRLVYVPLVLFGCFVLMMLYALWHDPLASRGPGHGIPCMCSVSLYALLPSLLLLRAIARLATTHAAWAGAMALLASFAAGGLLLRLNEPTAGIAHLLVWHYAPLAVATVLGLFIGRRFLRW